MKKKQEPPTSALSGTRLQTLALFIILLSFFLVLNSISTFEEEKVRPVIESIEATFANRVIREKLAPSVTKSEDKQSTEEGTVFDHLEELFQSQFTKISDTHTDDKKGLFITTIPLKKLENSLVDIRPHSLKDVKRSGTFLSLLKNLLSYKETKLRVDFVLLVPSNFLNSSQEKQIMVSNKVSYIGQNLELAGFPPTRLSVGIEEHENNDRQKETMVMVIIRPHIAYSPFKEHNGGDNE